MILIPVSGFTNLLALKKNEIADVFRPQSEHSGPEEVVETLHDSLFGWRNQ